MDREILELCSEVFKACGFKKLGNRIDSYLLLPDEKNLQDVLDEGLSWLDFSKHSKERAFSFASGYTMNRFFIVTAEKKYNDDGDPIIAINELPDENVTFKDNPIRNLFIVYNDEELRDKDYERVRFVMK